MLGNGKSGKSSFINIISTVFKGRHASAELRSYTVSLPDGGKTCNFKIWDAMGMEENGGLDTVVLPYIFDGNLPEGFDGESIYTPGIQALLQRWNKCVDCREEK